MLANDSPCWGSSFVWVMLAHAAILSAPLWWPNTPLPTDEEGNINAVMVELAPFPTAPPAPPSELPPGPAQQAQQAQPKPAPKPPEAKPEAKPLPEVVPDVKDPYQHVEEAQTAEESVQEQAAIAQTSAPPSVDAAPGDIYTGQQTVSGQVRQQAIASWQGVLLGHLEKHRRYPRQAQRLRLQGVSRMRFSVDRQGKVSNPRVAESSGHTLLDEEALATLLRASPVPAPPPEIPGDPVEIMIPVSFFMRGR